MFSFTCDRSFADVKMVIMMWLYDVQGKCQRRDPPCKYLHPPQHLKEQLLQNGRNNLIMKHLQMQMLAHAVPGVYPIVSAFILCFSHLNYPTPHFSVHASLGWLVVPQMSPGCSLCSHAALPETRQQYRSTVSPGPFSFYFFTHARVIIYIIKGDMFVYLSVCCRWPAELLGRSRPNLV